MVAVAVVGVPVSAYDLDAYELEFVVNVHGVLVSDNVSKSALLIFFLSANSLKRMKMGLIHHLLSYHVPTQVVAKCMSATVLPQDDVVY